MKLTDLDPQFLRYIGGPHERWNYVNDIEEAQGIWFLCPKCFAANNGPRGTHGVVCWSRSRGVPDEAEPGPGRWALAGTGYHDLSLEADPPSKARSVDLGDKGCGWHGFITKGEAR
jgi:hypothetical protein